jgi:peptidoglycan/xylan/chitin deacetylase (PgdA/CDA1 family)
MSNAGSTEFRRAVEEIARGLETQAPIRTVNYHSTSRGNAAQYRRELAAWGRRFSVVTEDDLDRYLVTGHWHKRKPGLIVALYDASRNGYDVILPLIEEAGLVAWYFVLTGFVNAAPGEQLAYAEAHDIGVQAAEYPDGRVALSWSELRDAEKRGHVVASHARSHVSLRTLSDAERESEILGSQADMRENLGHAVRTFVSYGGPAYGTHEPSDALIRRAGYQFVFSNLKVQRIR